MSRYRRRRTVIPFDVADKLTPAEYTALRADLDADAKAAERRAMRQGPEFTRHSEGTTDDRTD